MGEEKAKWKEMHQVQQPPDFPKPNVFTVYTHNSAQNRFAFATAPTSIMHNHVIFMLGFVIWEGGFS